VPLVRSRVQTPALPKKRKKKRERESNKVNLVKKKKTFKATIWQHSYNTDISPGKLKLFKYIYMYSSSQKGIKIS
jgi:hypothetical protein